MRLLATALIAMSLALTALAGSAAQTLRTDGIYQTDPPTVDSSDMKHYLNLRFMADGSVMRKESIEGVDLAEMAKRMTADNTYVSAGRYTRNGSKVVLDFDLGKDFTGKPMSLHAEGELLADGSIRFDERSVTLGEERLAVKRYFFVAVKGL